MEFIVGALGQVFTAKVLMVMVISAIYGLVIGAIPGLTATLAVALMVPITFFMDPVPAIAAIVTMAAMAIFAGDLPAVLLRMPGTPASAAYTDQAYRFTQAGRGEYILGMSACTSAIGGSIGVLALMFGAPLLARFALNFSSFEYFWLATLGLTAAIMVGGTRISKSVVSLLLGLLVASVGIDPVSGETRFTFGSDALLGGFGFIPVIIGLFAVAEILRYCTRSTGERELPKIVQQPLFVSGMRDSLRFKLGILRGSITGTLIGALPGAGADIAAYIAYAMGRRKEGVESSAANERAAEQIAPATAANNAAVGGSFIPAMVFGIPGDSLTAIVIGVLLMKGLNPGPTIFTDNASMINAVFIAFLLANLMLIPLGLFAVRLFKQVLRIPQGILMPSILLFAMVGAYAVENSLFAVVTILVFGLLGFLLEENDFPLAPMILGIVLGPLLEETFVTSMMRSNGSFLAFLERPVSLVLALITLAVWLTPPLLRLWRERRTSNPVLTD